MRKWDCTTAFEIEKPLTDSEYGCEYYFPHIIVEAETRGQAKAIFAEYMELDFIDVRAKIYKGSEEADLPYIYMPPVNQEQKEVLFTTEKWIVYKT